MPPVKRILPLLLAASACAHAPEAIPSPEAPPASPAPPPSPESATLTRIRTDVDALLTAQGEATWLAWTSGAPLDVSGAMRGREWLADGGALTALTAIPPSPDPAETARRRVLRDFLLGERLAAAAPPPASGAVDPSFTFEGRTVALRDSASMLAAEPDASRRAALDEARAGAAARGAKTADDRAAAISEAVRRLGLGDTMAVATELRRLPPASLAQLASRTLDATGPAYCAAMDALARGELGVPLASTRLRDLPRILRASHEPRAHAASRLVPDGQAAASAAGVDLATRVRLDDRRAAGKSQRPLAVAVRVPDDVRLSAMPSGGASEARAFLHELGVAIYLQAVRASGVEPRRLGTPAAIDTWGFLLEALAADPAWLHDRAGIVGDALAREIKAAQAERLHAVRMQAARLLREVDIAGGARPGAAGDAKLLSRVLCRPVSTEDAARWPIPRDPLLASADKLRGALLAAQVESALAEQGNGPWWRWKGAPEWLAPIWAEGSPASPEELARRVGVGEISPEPLARVARARFGAAGW